MWLPNKWIAALLGLLLQPLGMLYVAKVRLAVVYFVLIFLISALDFYLSSNYSFEWLHYFTFSYVLMLVCAYHAYKISITYKAPIARPWYSKWYGLLFVPFMFFISIFLFRSYLYEPFRLPSVSMYPTLMPGAVVIAKKWGYGNYGTFGISLYRTELSDNIKRGDLVVFEYPKDPTISYVKRIIGMPGELVEYEDKQLAINGQTENIDKRIAKATVVTNETEMVTLQGQQLMQDDDQFEFYGITGQERDCKFTISGTFDYLEILSIVLNINYGAK